MIGLLSNKKLRRSVILMVVKEAVLLLDYTAVEEVFMFAGTVHCKHKDFFSCNTTGFCINKEMVCDGHPHPSC